MWRQMWGYWLALFVAFAVAGWLMIHVVPQQPCFVTYTTFSGEQITRQRAQPCGRTP